MPGFGHVGLGGSVGWTTPRTEWLRIGAQPVLTPFVMTDHAAFVGIYALIRQAAERARERGFQPVTEFGPVSSREPPSADPLPSAARSRTYLAVRATRRPGSRYDLFPGASSCHNASVLTTDVAFEGLDGACPRGGRQARWLGPSGFAR